MPSEPATPKKYSLQWARGIVSELERRYTRALNQVLANYGITINDLVTYLSRGDPVFAYLKRRAQKLHFSMMAQEKAPLWVQMYSSEAAYLAKNSSGETFQRLDNRLKWVEARRAGSEGEAGDRSDAKGAGLPSVLFQFLLFPDEEGAVREVFEVRSL